MLKACQVRYALIQRGKEGGQPIAGWPCLEKLKLLKSVLIGFLEKVLRAEQLIARSDIDGQLAHQFALMETSRQAAYGIIKMLDALLGFL